jgi:hypothetical protein
MDFMLTLPSWLMPTIKNKIECMKDSLSDSRVIGRRLFEGGTKISSMNWPKT